MVIMCRALILMCQVLAITVVICYKSSLNVKHFFLISTLIIMDSINKYKNKNYRMFNMMHFPLSSIVNCMRHKHVILLMQNNLNY